VGRKLATWNADGKQAATLRRVQAHVDALLQAFGLERHLHRRPGRHAQLVGGQGRPLGQLDLHVGAPAQHREQIGVGHAETLAQQVILAGQLLVHEGQALAEDLARDALGARRRRPG
jgi:hypothetical protein